METPPTPSVTLRIDGAPVTVPAGSTILDAARKLGLDIPTLCYLNGTKHPRASCLACVVRLQGQTRLIPSCATAAAEGMQVESEVPAVRESRKAALELLFSDHLGDCVSVCQRVCPARMQIPRVIRLVADGKLEEAIRVVKENVALPEVVGHICRAACENGCRRSKHDGAVAIRSIERHVAEIDRAKPERYVPACRPSTGKRVAIIGCGPTGLAAAFYLLERGHAAVVFDDHLEPGGMLRYGVPENELPREALDGDIETILRMGMEFQGGMRLGRDIDLAGLRADFDAVLLTVGNVKDLADPKALAVQATARGIKVEATSFETNIKGVFAGGASVHGRKEVARALGDGRILAECADKYLAGEPIHVQVRDYFTCTIPKLSDAEFFEFVKNSKAVYGQRELVLEAEKAAGRCCHCDCRMANNCKLRRYGDSYDVDPKRHVGGQRRPFEIQNQHAGVVFESGKCISCGICVDIAAEAREPLGMTFIGRGFDVRIGVPFSETIATGLQRVADEAVRHCPTGALAYRDEPLNDTFEKT